MTTYYVNAKTGNDGNDGASVASAWKSVEFVNQHTLKPGDTVLFHSGDIYHATLIPRSSGTADAPITFGSFGSGPAPEFRGSVDLGGAIWSRVSGNVWSTKLPNEGRFGTEQVWFNGERGNIASVRVGAVDQPGDWYWGDGTLYVYSASDPSSAYKSVEANVLDYVAEINGKNFLRLENLAFSHARQNVFVQGSKGTQLINLDVHGSVRDGILLRNSDGLLIQGGQSHDNGVTGTAKKATHLGHGILFGTGAANTTVKDTKLYGNTEDGIQFGNRAGSGNVISNNKIWGNLEDGIDIKHGSHSFLGNEIYGNVDNAILVHNSADTQILSGNLLRTQSKANALDVSSGKVVSTGNWYQGAKSFTVQLSSPDGSTFRNDLFVDGGAKAGVSVVVQDGAGHSFDNATFIMRNEGSAIRMTKGADNIAVTHSIIYGEGADLLRLDSGKIFKLEGNTYWRTDGKSSWVIIDGAGREGSAWLKSADRSAIIADPQFVDGRKNDFSLKPGSPAAACGAKIDSFDPGNPVPTIGNKAQNKGGDAKGDHAAYGGIDHAPGQEIFLIAPQLMDGGIKAFAVGLEGVDLSGFDCASLRACTFRTLDWRGEAVADCDIGGHCLLGGGDVVFGAPLATVF